MFLTVSCDRCSARIPAPLLWRRGWTVREVQGRARYRCPAPHPARAYVELGAMPGAALPGARMS